MQPHTNKEDVTRFCGHTAAFTFDRSKSSKDSMVQRSEARKSLCPDCVEKLIGWLSTAEIKTYPIELPEIRGTVKTAPWARQIRAKELAKYAPIMQVLSENSTDPLARAALAAYSLLFTIESAKFWIDNRIFKYDRWWLTSEISSLVKEECRFGKTYAAYSAYGHYRNSGLNHIAQARQAANWDLGEPELKAVSGL